MNELEKLNEADWDIDQTIENLNFLREHLMSDFRKINHEGKGEQDAHEVNVDLTRAIEALKVTSALEKLKCAEDAEPIAVVLMPWSERACYDCRACLDFVHSWQCAFGVPPHREIDPFNVPPDWCPRHKAFGIIDPNGHIVHMGKDASGKVKE